VASIDLPDINVWLALTAEDHPHWPLAEKYWNEHSAAQIAFNAVTMLGLVRIASATVALGPRPLTPVAAWEMYLAWRSRPGVAYVNEPRGCSAALNSFVASGLVTPRLWTDAYLAAFAVAAGLRLITFDRDLERFPDLNVLLLSG
jgi:toxin-antitoxin system PIN domain toxin